MTKLSDLKVSIFLPDETWEKLEAIKADLERFHAEHGELSPDVLSKINTIGAAAAFVGSPYIQLAIDRDEFEAHVQNLEAILTEGLGASLSAEQLANEIREYFDNRTRLQKFMDRVDDFFYEVRHKPAYFLQDIQLNWTMWRLRRSIYAPQRKEARRILWWEFKKFVRGDFASIRRAREARNQRK